jgi:hypothetical protein
LQAFSFAVALLFAVSAGVAYAEPSGEPPQDAASSPEWQFAFAPYIWGTAIDGTLEADSVSTDVDVSFSDIWDALDIAALGAFEARRGKLSLTTNVIYMKLSTDESKAFGGPIPIAPGGSFDVDADAQSLIVEGRAAWEVLSLPLFGAGDERRIALDVGPAFRVWWLDTETDVKLKPGIPIGPFKTSVDASTDWVDFVAAARVRAQLLEKLTLVISGDYGGFDIGSSSHKTWSLSGIASYRLGEHWDLLAGWRTLSIERGAIDAKMEGPLVGASYSF